MSRPIFSPPLPGGSPEGAGGGRSRGDGRRTWRVLSWVLRRLERSRSVRPSLVGPPVEGGGRAQTVGVRVCSYGGGTGQASATYSDEGEGGLVPSVSRAPQGVGF